MGYGFTSFWCPGRYMPQIIFRLPVGSPWQGVGESPGSFRSRDAEVGGRRAARLWSCRDSPLKLPSTIYIYTCISIFIFIPFEKKLYKQPKWQTLYRRSQASLANAEAAAADSGSQSAAASSLKAARRGYPVEGVQWGSHQEQSRNMIGR